MQYLDYINVAKISKILKITLNMELPMIQYKFHIDFHQGVILSKEKHPPPSQLNLSVFSVLKC